MSQSRNLGRLEDDEPFGLIDAARFISSSSPTRRGAHLRAHTNTVRERNIARVNPITVVFRTTRRTAGVFGAVKRFSATTTTSILAIETSVSRSSENATNRPTVVPVQNEVTTRGNIFDFLKIVFFFFVFLIVNGRPPRGLIDFVSVADSTKRPSDGRGTAH